MLFSEMLKTGNVRKIKRGRNSYIAMLVVFRYKLILMPFELLLKQVYLA
jgi:hypothetical protein